MSQAEGVRIPHPVEAAGPSRSAALVRRLLSTLVLLPLFVWMVIDGPMWLFGAAMVLVGALGQWEFTGMFERAGVRTLRFIGLVGGSVLAARSRARGGVDPAPGLGHLARRDRGLRGRLDPRAPQARSVDQPAQDDRGRGGPARDVGARGPRGARVVLPRALAPRRALRGLA